MRLNKALGDWREGRQTVGGWLSIGNGYTAELMANMGFDGLCIEMQHGMVGYEDLKHMLPAIATTSVTPLVRVPWNDPAVIMKTLDAGAYGVIVPMINSRQRPSARSRHAATRPKDSDLSVPSVLRSLLERVMLGKQIARSPALP